MSQAFLAPLGGPVVEGRLVYDDQLDCVFVEYNGTRLPALWPYGYGWAVDQSGVQSPDGKHLAKIGEPVRLVAVRGHKFTLGFDGPRVGTTALQPGASCIPDGDDLMIMAIE